MCVYTRLSSSEKEPPWGEVLNTGLRQSTNQPGKCAFRSHAGPSERKPINVMFLSKVAGEKWGRNTFLQVTGMIGSPAEDKELRVNTQKENTKMKKLRGENNVIQQHFCEIKAELFTSVRAGNQFKVGPRRWGADKNPLNDWAWGWARRASCSRAAHAAVQLAQREGASPGWPLAFHLHSCVPSPENKKQTFFFF